MIVIKGTGQAHAVNVSLCRIFQNNTFTPIKALENFSTTHSKLKFTAPVPYDREPNNDTHTFLKMLSSTTARQALSSVVRASTRSLSTSSAGLDTSLNTSLFPKLDSISQSDLVFQKNQVSNEALKTSEKEWYNITRTRGNQLPVYSYIRGNGDRSTIIRRIEGSAPLLKSDLMAILGLHRDDIKIKATSNQLKIKGDYVDLIKSLFDAAKF